MSTNAETSSVAEIALLTMGGTLDKDYFDALSEYQVSDSTILSDLALCGLQINARVESICKKDSLELVEADRQALVDAIQKTGESIVLVSHGTDTMVETARYIQSAVSTEHRRIVLFGAMRPSRFKHSDAQLNFAFALGAARALAPGVYIAMSGQVFEPDQVVKNRDAQRFEVQ